MVCRLLAILLLTVWAAAPALADHYRYYKVRASDTLVSVALQFGVDRGVILAMNPHLTADARLEPGSVLCVPDPDYKPGQPLTAPVKPARPPATAARQEPVKVALSSQEADERELDFLARFANGLADEDEPEDTGHRNVFIGSDGRVVEVPIAEGREQHSQVVQQNHRRRSLSSRRGRALYGLLKTSRSFMGIPYVWGGESPSGADCSGYVQMVFNRHGVKLPRTADVQFKVGKPVEKGKEQPGDLVFFETYAPGASHVGIYLGQGKFIHASSRARQVTVSELAEPYFAKRYLGARRNL